MKNVTSRMLQQLEEKLKVDTRFHEEMAANVAKRTDKLNDATIDIAIRLKQARDFMEWSTSHIRTIWMQWLDESDKASRDINQFRMMFDRETKTVIAAGKDLAVFFNSEEYLKAHATLKETVAILERFSEYKQNGTLDALADFILKITCR